MGEEADDQAVTLAQLGRDGSQLEGFKGDDVNHRQKSFRCDGSPRQDRAEAQVERLSSLAPA